MEIKIPEIEIFSSHEWKFIDNFPFCLKFWVKQDQNTQINFPFLPFCGVNVRKEHALYLNSEERANNRSDAELVFKTLQEAKEAEKRIVSEIQDLFNAWIEGFNIIKEWAEPSLKVHDLVKQEEEKKEE